MWAVHQRGAVATTCSCPMVRSPFCRSHGLGASLLERLMACRSTRSRVYTPSSATTDRTSSCWSSSSCTMTSRSRRTPTRSAPKPSSNGRSCRRRAARSSSASWASCRSTSTSYWNDVEASRWRLIQQLVRVDEHGRPIGGGERASGGRRRRGGGGRGRGRGRRRRRRRATPRKTSDVAVVTPSASKCSRSASYYVRSPGAARRQSTTTKARRRRWSSLDLRTAPARRALLARSGSTSRSRARWRCSRRRQPLGSLRRQDVAPSAEVCHRQGGVPRLRPPAVHGGRRGHRR